MTSVGPFCFLDSFVASTAFPAKAAQRETLTSKISFPLNNLPLGKLKIEMMLKTLGSLFNSFIEGGLR